MKLAKQAVIPYQPIQNTLSAAINHVETSDAYTAETKSVSRAITNNIQQNFTTSNIAGIYGLMPKEIKSTIIQTLKEIKEEFPEKPWLAALKSLGTGLKLAGIGTAIYKGEFGTGEIKDISDFSGLSIAEAMPSYPPTDILGIANLFVEKAIEFCEHPNEDKTKLSS